jgi:transcriptional regulator with XRE-family HTH domain/tetratricopeptide (TPR) repeat protein
MRLNVGNLKSSIAQKRIKKTDLALDIGVTRETLSRWLAGRIEYIDEGKLIKLSEILGCELSWLSPEIPPVRFTPPPVLHPSQVIRGDDFIRMGLYSGLWNEIANLHAHARHPEIVQDPDANGKLFQVLGCLMNLDFTDMDKLRLDADPLQRNHELFDVIARHSLVDGIVQMIAGDGNEANRKFKRVMIQGQTEWLVAFAYLMSGLCQCMRSSPQEACETLDKGLTMFGNSHDDLTIFALANIHLLLCVLQIREHREQAKDHLDKARSLFDTAAYRYGHLRCVAYEALLLAYENKPDASRARTEDVITHVRRMPRLYQTEALLICAKASFEIGDRDLSLQYFEMADERAKNADLFSYLTKVQWLKVAPSHDTLQAQVARLKEKFETFDQERTWKKVL